jgi:hypothetical protein
MTEHTTATGVPTVPMWGCAMPQAALPGAGFPLLGRARNVCLFQATREHGAYNHHAQLICHENVFHAMWSNHPAGEDGPGQRILHSRSVDGANWEPWETLFAPPGPVLPSEEKGLALTALRWLVLDSRLFAVVALHRNLGFTDQGQQLAPVAQRDALHPARAREGYAPLARCVGESGSPSAVFSLGSGVPRDLALDTGPDPTSCRIQAVLWGPEHLPSWDFEGLQRYPLAAADAHRLCEPTTYRNGEGRWTMLLRDTVYSHRMYVSYLAESTGTWLPAHPTNIPDSPSLSCAVALGGGGALLVGNQMAPALDNPEEHGHYSRDPLTVAFSADGKLFTKCFALRCGVQSFRVPQSHVRGRGGGAQYPSALVHGGQLHVLYSMGKEDICATSVDLDSIPLPST